MKRILIIGLLLISTKLVIAIGPSGPAAIGIQYPAQLAAAGGGGGASVLQSTLSITYTNIGTVVSTVNVTAGSLLKVTCAFYGNGTTPSLVSIANTGLDTFTVTQSSANAGNVNMFLLSAYAKNVAGGANTVTVTMNAEVNTCVCGVTEYSGLSTSSPLVHSNAKTGNSALAGSGPMNLGSGKLVTGAATNDTGTVPALYTPLNDHTRRGYSPDGNTNVNMAYSDLGSTSTVVGAVQASSFSINSSHWIMIGEVWQ